MKQGRDLKEVLVELQRQNEAKRDFVSPAEAFSLSPDGRTFAFGNEVMGTTDLFHRQVASALSIPA